MAAQWTRKDRVDLLVGSAAVRCHRKWRFVSVEDLRQELYLWVYEHPDFICRYLDDRSIPGNQAEHAMSGALMVAGERLARRERAALYGYDVDDECFYTVPMLRDLLPMALDDDAWMRMGTASPDGVPTRYQDPAEGGNLVTMLADVALGLDTLGRPDRLLLRERYRFAGESEVDAALRMDMDVDKLRARVNRAIGRLRFVLGGKRPDSRAPERVYVGSRKAVSNAVAVFLTTNPEKP